MDKDSKDFVLKGTTLRVYRYLYRNGSPTGIHDLQRGLKLSSPSVAEYHIKKLVEAGLIQERTEGYAVDRRIFENLIRIRRTVIPFQTTYVSFFAATLVILLTLLKPSVTTSTYIFAIGVNVAALLIAIYEAAKTLSNR